MTDKHPQIRSSSVAEFLKQANTLPARQNAGPRLIFALDATASRGPTWEQARALHDEMFRAAEKLNQLEVQLCYYRGLGEFYASPWGRSAGELQDQMAGVECRGGYTQIGLLLEHALFEARENPVKALVFIGDALEESVDRLCELAGQCRLRGLPLFIFQEGADPDVTRAFKQMSHLSGGAHASFDASSAQQLAQLLRAVATWASGGVDALRKLKDNGARQLLEQL